MAQTQNDPLALLATDVFAALLDVINNPEKTQQTTAIGTLF